MASIAFRRLDRPLLFVAVALGCGNAPDDCVEQDRRVAELQQALSVCEASRVVAEPASEPPPTQDSPDEAASAPPEIVSAWERTELADRLTGRPIVNTVARSREEFELDFPYQGRQRAQLALREHPRFGNDVILSVEQGQILCHVSRCSVDIVFDDGDVVHWRADPSEAGTSEVVFLSQHDRFARELRRAHEVRIAVTFYRSGTRTFTFPGLADSE